MCVSLIALSAALIGIYAMLYLGSMPRLGDPCTIGEGSGRADGMVGAVDGELMCIANRAAPRPTDPMHAHDCGILSCGGNPIFSAQCYREYNECTVNPDTGALIHDYNCLPGMPMPEVCDGLDNNCDYKIDNGVEGGCPLIAAPTECYVTANARLLMEPNPWLNLYMFKSIQEAVHNCQVSARTQRNERKLVLLDHAASFASAVDDTVDLSEFVFALGRWEDISIRLSN